MSEPERLIDSINRETAVLGTDPAFQPARDLTGTTLGDFHVERRLGRGGMGEVYLATQVSLNRPVALKVLKPDLLANPTYLSRFEAEAWAAAKLNHPNIVHIYTLGCIDGIRFIAMEYVQGTNLREYIERKGPPELPLALSIMRQAGQAVGAAGETGLVHRDIKPENLLLTRKGQVKVADFGLCRDKEGQHLNLTQPGVTMGTPMYMSPEQVQGHPLDHRSDLYSLGVTFYHMLAGQPPFRAETALALALRHVRDQAVSLAVHRPDLPPDLVALVMRLLEKDADRRYPSAAELLRDLARIKGALNAATTPVSVQMTGLVPGTSVPAQPTEPAPAPQHTSLLGRLRRVEINGKTIAAAVAVALVVGGACGWMARAEDLLGPNAREPSDPPGLWLAPWTRVPAQRTAAAQYRYALMQAAEPDQEAAWLAVPGRFPNSGPWTYNAYIQLARYLFRHHDAASLKVLAKELAREGRAHEEKKLAVVVEAAARAAEADINGVLDLLDGDQNKNDRLPANDAYHVGLTALSLEIVTNCRGTPGAAQHAASLQEISRRLQLQLRMDALDPAGSAVLR